MTPPQPSAVLTPKRASEYRAIIGDLRYLADSTRPYIAHPTSLLATNMSNPHPHHLVLAIHVLRYLAGTPTYGILYRPACEPTIAVYLHADWATGPDRKSYTGHITTVAGAPIAWVAKKQKVFALSKCEA